MFSLACNIFLVQEQKLVQVFGSKPRQPGHLEKTGKLHSLVNCVTVYRDLFTLLVDAERNLSILLLFGDCNDFILFYLLDLGLQFYRFGGAFVIIVLGKTKNPVKKRSH